MDKDHHLQQNVIDELMFDPAVDSAHIGVSAHDGVITLTGHVGTASEKSAAERAAYRVRGVRAVAQEIEVRLPSERKLADDQIAERAVHILRWDSAVPDERLHVRVEHGLVTLSGTVDWEYQRRAAESDVRRLSGVIGVHNRIQVEPVVQVREVSDLIDKAFKRSAELDALRIEVTVRNSTIVLEGIVRDQRQREVAERAAWSLPGVTMVDDRLRIV